MMWVCFQDNDWKNKSIGRQVVPHLQLQTALGILEYFLRLNTGPLVLVSGFIPLSSPNTCTHTHTHTHAHAHTQASIHSYEEQLSTKADSPTSVTASIEAPVFSSSSMTRIWFFLQAMCKGVKPFCGPTQRRQTSGAYTLAKKHLKDLLAV
jgi:hypothetical protein